jgi:hypothetical protein
MFSSLVEHFMYNSQNSTGIMKKMTGGVSVMSETSGNSFMLFLITLCLFLIKVLLVMISYNIVIPRILDSYSVDMQRFRQISFWEAIFLVILFNNLFSRF